MRLIDMLNHVAPPLPEQTKTYIHPSREMYRQVLTGRALTSGQIANKTGMSRSAVDTAMRRFEKDGLVSREGSPIQWSWK